MQPLSVQPSWQPEAMNVQPSVSMVPMAPVYQSRPPEDHLCWSIFSVLWCNFCCFGWLALYFSAKTRSEKDNMFMDSATKYSSRAKCCNIVLLVIGIISVILCIAFIAVIITNIEVRVNVFEAWAQIVAQFTTTVVTHSI